MSEESSFSFTPFIFGGMFLGVWIYGSLFGFGFSDFNPGAWTGWGFLGLVLGGSLFAVKFLDDIRGKIAVYTAIGMLLMILVLAGIFEQRGEMFGMLPTVMGTAMIAASFPRQPSTANE